MPVIVPAAGYTMSGDTSARATGLQRLVDELTTARTTSLDRLINDLTAARAAALDRLINDLTAVRAGRLDVLGAGGAGELTGARAAALDRLINDLTAARAANMDVAVSTRATPADLNAEIGDGNDAATADGAPGTVHSKLRRLDVAVGTRAAAPQAPSYFVESALAAQAANAALLDSGPLAAGNYEIVASVVANALAGPDPIGRADVEHRNAANDGNIRSRILNLTHTPAVATGDGVHREMRWPAVAVALNERIRVNKSVADGANSRSAYSLYVRPV